MKSPLEQFDVLTIKIYFLGSLDLTFQNIFLPVICILICFIIYIIW